MSTAPRGWRVPLLLVSTATVFSVVALAGVGEWAARHRERTRTSVPGTMSMMFYRHDRLMHGLVRGTDYFGWVSIGREGFRGAREVPVSPPDSVFRIIAVGGSTTFDGNTSGDSSAWPARLEQILDSAGTTQRVEVLNAGVPGFQVFDDLVRLEYELYRYEPDLIILYQGHNDLFNTLAHAARGPDTSFNPRPGEIPTVYPGQVWLERHSLLYHKLRSRWQAIRFRSSGASMATRVTAAEYDRVVDGGVESYARNVRAFLAVAQSMGVEVVIPQAVYAARTSTGGVADSTIATMWRRAIPYAPPANVWTGYARYDSAGKAAALSFGARHVAASDPSLWSIEGYAPGDPIHFNDSGAWRFARHVSTAIRPLIDSPPTP